MQIQHRLTTLKSTVVRSLTDLDFYVEVLNTPLRKSLKITALFYVFLGIVLAVFFTLKTLPEASAHSSNAVDEFVLHYPQNLLITWQSPKLYTNVDEPLIIPFPKDAGIDESAPKNLAIINTKTEDVPENTNALFFISNTKLFVNSLHGDWTQAPLTDVLDFESGTLDKDTVIRLSNKAKAALTTWVAVLPWLSLLFFTLGLLFVRLLVTLLYAVVIYFSFQLMKKPIGYWKVWQLSLAILIPSELVNQFSNHAFPALPISMFSLTFWVVSTLLMWHLRHLKVVRTIRTVVPESENKKPKKTK